MNEKTLEKAEKLVWKNVLHEDKENFTPEFRKQVLETLKVVMLEKGRVNFKCSKCGNESWFKVNLETYIVSIEDLICDDCNPVEEDE